MDLRKKEICGLLVEVWIGRCPHDGRQPATLSEVCLCTLSRLPHSWTSKGDTTPLVISQGNETGHVQDMLRKWELPGKGLATECGPLL